MCGNTECNVSVGKLEMWQYCSENFINLRRSPGSSYLQHRTLATCGQHSQLPVAFASDAQQCCGVVGDFVPRAGAVAGLSRGTL